MSGSEQINLVVLFGGQSAEHDVSCTTAAHVIAAADSSRYRIIPVGIAPDGRWALAQEPGRSPASDPETIPASLNPAGTPVSPTTLLEEVTSGAERTVVMPLLHGPLGEDGTVQGLLELCNVAYVGSGVLGSALAMDKSMAKEVLEANGIAQARYRTFTDHEQWPGLADELISHLGLPCFVKPANMGSSVGITKAHTIEDLHSGIALALTYDERVVVEEAVVGREIEVAVLGNLNPEASVAGEIVPGDEFYSYEDKYITNGAQLCVPALLDDDAMEQVRRLALRVFTTLRCEGLARVDFFYEQDGRGFLCNEVNTMPGFTPISMFPKLWLHSAMSYAELIDRLVELALERHARRRRNLRH
jgi:D-alanine--D-alanine ligase